MSLKIIVTGGSGFIGSALIKILIEKYGHDVVNIDKLTYAANPKSLESVESTSNYKFYECDICDFDMVQNIFTEEQPNKIMHLAAESHVDRSISSPIDFIQTNIFGTYQLLEISKNYFEKLSSDKKGYLHFITYLPMRFMVILDPTNLVSRNCIDINQALHILLQKLVLII